MKKYILIALLIVFAVFPMCAEEKESHEKAGSAMMGEFLKLNWDPASYALADAYSGFSDNFAGSIFVNPAGIARLKNSQLTLSSVIMPLTGANLFFAGVQQNFGIEVSMAIGGAHLNYGEEEETDITGFTYNTFTNKNTMAFVSFASALGGGLYLGFTGKYVDQLLYNNYQKTFLGDVGLQYIPEVFKKIGIGLSVTNIGISNAMAYNDSELRAPTVFHLGWVVKLIDTYGSGLSFSFDNTFPIDGTYKLSLGGQLSLGNTIILRAGYKALGWDIPELTMGLGIVFSNAVKLDVGYSKKGNLGVYQLASLSMIFGMKPKVSKDWEADIHRLSEIVDSQSKTIGKNKELAEALVEELDELKGILAESSADLRSALEESKVKAAAELAQQAAEQEAMKQRMMEEQQKAVEEAARKAAEEAAERIRKEYEEKMNKIKSEIEQDKNIEIKEDTRGIVLNLQGINFASGKADVPPYSYPTLDRVARVISQYPDSKIRVEGHTDSIGRSDYNMSLSNLRARSVMMYFIEKHAINPARIEAVGFGQTKPIADNSTNEGRARNRRVEIIIMGVQKPTEQQQKKEDVKKTFLDTLESGPAIVYVGSYEKEDDAMTEVRKLQDLGYRPSIARIRLTGGEGERIIFRVKMGEYTEESAQRLVDRLKTQGFDGWIRK